MIDEKVNITREAGASEVDRLQQRHRPRASLTSKVNSSAYETVAERQRKREGKRDRGQILKCPLGLNSKQYLTRGHRLSFLNY